MLVVDGANAVPITYRFDTPFETKTTQRPFDAGSEFLLDGLFGPPSAADQSFTFTAGNAGSIYLSSAWVVGTPPFRLVGVNVDLIDGTNTVVASDQFSSVVNGQAFSTLSFTGLVPGAEYTINLTGTAQGTGRFQIQASSSPPGSATPIPIGPDAQPFDLLFDTREGTKRLGAPLPAGQALRADTIVSELAGGQVDETLRFTVGAARDFAGAFTWVFMKDGVSQTVGFNADLLDSNGQVVASDQFRGVTGGQAFSTFDTFLSPGDYSFNITALSQQASTRFRLDIVSGGDAPAFTPLPDGPAAVVPEPATLMLLGGGLLALAGMRHRIGRRARL